MNNLTFCQFFLRYVGRIPVKASRFVYQTKPFKMLREKLKKIKLNEASICSKTLRRATVDVLWIKLIEAIW